MQPRKRRQILNRLICLMLAFPMTAAGIQASNLTKRLSLRLNPGGIFSLGGNYNDTEKLKDIVSVGLGAGAGFRYEVNENIYLDAGYTLNYFPVKEDKRPFDYKHTDSVLSLSSFTLNGMFFLKSGYKMEPYITLGGGIYPWQFSQDMFGGKAWSAPGKPEENFSNSSFGLNGGLGIEVSVWMHLSVVGEIKYMYLFSRDIAKFGTDDFTQQDFLGVNIGIVYYFSRK